MTDHRGSPLLMLAIPLAVGFLATIKDSQAQVEPNIEAANRPLWEAGVSAIGIISPAYPGAADRNGRGLALPWLIYRGPILRADGGSIGARVLKTERVEFDVGAAAALGASSDDVEARKGMPDLGFQFEFGPRVRVTLMRPAPDSVVRLDLPLRGVFEINDGLKSRGVAFEPRLSYESRDIGGGWGLGASAGVVFGDRKLNQFLYGVPTAFATPTRAAYSAKSGLITPRAQLTLSRKFGDDLRFFAFSRYDFAGSGANRDSPLHLRNGGASLGLGAAWTLGRSSQRAID